MYLFIDAETTGTPLDRSAPISNRYNWPRLVQFAWASFDGHMKQINSRTFLIKPEGYIIPDEATKVHGITTKDAISNGSNLQEVLNAFAIAVKKCYYIIGHNVDFDQKVIAAEFFRYGVTNEILLKREICTMRSTVDYCKIPFDYGYKWPSLSELYLKLFKKEFKGSHRADSDIQATIQCFEKLVANRIIKIPLIGQMIFEPSKIPQNMNIIQQAKWFRGFSEPLGYCDTISDAQIEILNNNLNLLIESIARSYDDKEYIINKAVSLRGFLDSIFYGEARNATQVDLLKSNIESLVDLIEEDCSDDDSIDYSEPPFRGNTGSIPSANEITEPIDDLPF